MPETDPLSLDFATLRTLCLVHDSGSFTAAAEQIGVNQSAISYTIERLRRAFHDPLFVREKGRQIATQRCQQIIAEVRPMLATLDRLARPEAFDPASADQRLTLACNYYERLLIVPLLAFDRRGFRLGYGGGFYDRTLARLRAAGPVTAIGFAFAAQEVEEVPTEPTDAALDLIVTDAETIVPDPA